jgi:hypothetical protein
VPIAGQGLPLFHFFEFVKSTKLQKINYDINNVKKKLEKVTSPIAGVVIVHYH